MKKDDVQLYEELVAKYSKVFYKRASAWFELEDLAQEAWIAILTAENKFEPEREVSKRTFLVTCIRNHLVEMIYKEIREKNTVSSNEEEDKVPDETVLLASELLLHKELVKSLQLRVKEIKHGEFVLDKVRQGYSVRDISTITKEKGEPVSKSMIHNVVKQIRKAFYFTLNE